MQAENAGQPPDAIYGPPSQKPIGHLLFRWLTRPDGTFSAGHYDLLEPGEGDGMKLPREAPIHFLNFQVQDDLDADGSSPSFPPDTPVGPETEPSFEARVSAAKPSSTEQSFKHFECIICFTTSFLYIYIYRLLQVW